MLTLNNIKSKAVKLQIIEIGSSNLKRIVEKTGLTLESFNVHNVTPGSIPELAMSRVGNR